MKIRLSFVSNSSSCSFTCPTCHNSWEGWDWDEDPVCNECGCYIFRVKETFAEYLIKKYNLDMKKETLMYLSDQNENYRQEYIKEYGEEPK